MTRDARRILDAALALSEGERADLATRLMESLDSQSDSAAAAWDETIQQRLADLDDGKVRPVGWDSVRSRLENTVNGPSEH